MKTLTSNTLNSLVHSTQLRAYEKRKNELMNEMNALYGKIIKSQEVARKVFKDNLQSLFDPKLDIQISESSGYFTGHVTNLSELPKSFYSGIHSRELFSYNSNKNSLNIYLWDNNNKPMAKVIKFTKDTDTNKVHKYVMKFCQKQLKRAGKI